MYCSKRYFFLIVEITLIISVSFTALPKVGGREEITLEEGVKFYLEREGKAAFSLQSPMDVEKIHTEEKWVKVQITGWVLKSKISKLSPAEDQRGSKEAQKKEEGPVIKGEAGPFHIKIQDIHFADKVQDRFGTVYKSGAGGSFLVVNIIAQNNNNRDRNLYKTNIVLVDGNGRQYKSVGISNEESFKGGSIKPEEVREGYLFFSVFDDSDLEAIQIEGRPCSSCTKYRKVFELGEITSDTSNN